MTDVPKPPQAPGRAGGPAPVQPSPAGGPAPVQPSAPSALAVRWPGPSGAAGRAVIGGALLTGLAAAGSVPLDRPGAGWVLTAAVGTASLIVIARTAAAGPAGPGGPTDGRWPKLARIGWALATLALLGSGAVRAAGWLFVLCLLAAAGTGSLAVSGGRSVGGLLAGALAWPVAAVRALPWAVRGTRRLGGAEVRAALTIAVTVLLVVVFGALFAAADAAFARAVSALTTDVSPSTTARWMFLVPAGAAALLGAAYLLQRPPDLSGLERPGRGRLRPFEWGLPIVALDLLFTAFVAVQFTVLFGGRAHVLGPDGPDYADYARSGFWQLLTVTVLTLIVIGVAARGARRAHRRDRVLIRALLGALAGLALVVVASALYRMHVYEQAYGFTRLRVLVSVCELWLGVVFAFILGAGVRLRADWLPRAVAGTAVAALLGLVALDADRFIAERNIDRYAASGRIDISYLSDLSADAAPALDRLPAVLRDCALRELARKLAREPDSWHETNLARGRARELLDAAPVDTGLLCPP